MHRAPIMLACAVAGGRVGPCGWLARFPAAQSYSNLEGIRNGNMGDAETGSVSI